MMTSTVIDMETTKPRNKRVDPKYTKITVDVPKTTSGKLKAICALLDVNFSDAVDEALSDWIAKQKKKNNAFEI